MLIFWWTLNCAVLLQVNLSIPFDTGLNEGGYFKFPCSTGYCYAADGASVLHSFADAKTTCDADDTCRAINCKRTNDGTTDCTSYETSTALCCVNSAKCGHVAWPDCQWD